MTQTKVFLSTYFITIPFHLIKWTKSVLVSKEKHTEKQTGYAETACRDYITRRA